MTYESIRKALLAAYFIAVLPISPASASPIGGTATLGFDNGGTLSGFFNYDTSAQTISSWTLTTTDFGTSHVYDSSNTADGASSIILANSNMDEVFSFFQNFPDNNYELDIVIACHGTANCVTFGATNVAFAVVGGRVTCPPGTPSCISSGEQQPFGVLEHFLNDGFLNVTDPPSTLAFNVDSSIAPGFTEFTGAANVPEPSSLLLLMSAGLIGCMVRSRKRILR